MILGIDASRMTSEASTGVEFYSRHIIAAILRELKGRKNAPEIVLYTPKKLDIIMPRNQFHDFKEQIIPFPRFWTQIRLSYEMIVNPPDALFVPSHVIPFYHPQKTITTIHDVAFKYTRESYSNFQYWYLNFAAWFACRFAYKIIVPSNAVKQDLMRFYDCDRNKIFVVYHGMDAPSPPENFTENNESEILRRFGIAPGQKYILFIGRLEEKKNLSRLISAFEAFLKKYPDWKMILGGKRGFGFEKIWRAVDSTNLWNKVLMPGYIDETEKYALMKNCSIVALPSLQEGFGFPILEALHYKKPILTSDIPAIHEVAGDAAIFVNPYKEEEITAGLERLAKSKVLRDKLIAEAAKQAKKFKWSEAAKKTLKILLN